MKNIKQKLIYCFTFFIYLIAMTNNVAHAQEQEIEWTILIYMNADDPELDSYAIRNITEMESIPFLSEKISIIVQLDRYGPTKKYVTNSPPGLRFKVENGKSTVIEELLTEQNMNDPETLYKFIDWGIKKYPSKKTCVIIWAHGDGFVVSNDSTTNFKQSESPNGMSGNEIVNSLKKINKKIDIIAFDSCLMQTLENAYEMQAIFNYQIASESLIPSDGFPYNLWFKQISDNPTVDPKEFGNILIKNYKYFYSSERKATTSISMIDLSKVNDFISSMNKVIIHIDINKNKQNIIQSREESQNYSDDEGKDTERVDLYDVFKNIFNKIDKKEEYSLFIDSIRSNKGDSLVLYNETTDTNILIGTYLMSGPPIKSSYGVSIWFPESIKNELINKKCTTTKYLSRRYENYRGSNFSKISEWDNSLILIFCENTPY